jgi:hypothetical protein
MRLRSARRSASSAVVCVAMLCILISCGTNAAPSQASPASPTTAATTASPTTACADVAALKSSLEQLTKVRPLQDGVGALTSAIANVKNNLDKAKASAAPALQPSLQQVETAFAELQTAASGLSADNLKEKAPAIATALAQLAAATKALSSAIAESCPGS